MNAGQLRKRIQSIDKFGWLCWLPFIISSLWKFIDYQSARDASLFRFICNIVGLTLFVALQIAKARWTKQLQMLERNEMFNEAGKL